MTMFRSPNAAIAAVLAVAVSGRAAPAQSYAAQPSLTNTTMPQGELCTRAIQQAEAGSGLPPRLLGAIATVESGRRDPVTQRVQPWPWTINAQGRGHFFAKKAEAIAFARDLQQRDIDSFDVGCMQINLMYHPDAFGSLDEAFDPGANARYAVRFLRALRDKTGDWETASAWYHSANPAEGGPYRQLVAAAMGRMTDSPAAIPAVANFVPFQAGPAAFPVTMRFLPGSSARIIMLPGASGLQQGAVGASAANAPVAFGRGGMVGRTLDSYRAAPVAVARLRMASAK
jgi:hypothetical protein